MEENKEAISKTESEKATEMFCDMLSNGAYENEGGSYNELVKKVYEEVI